MQCLQIVVMACRKRQTPHPVLRGYTGRFLETDSSKVIYGIGLKEGYTYQQIFLEIQYIRYMYAHPTPMCTHILPL
jgi:ribosomal protein L21E